MATTIRNIKTLKQYIYKAYANLAAFNAVAKEPGVISKFDRIKQRSYDDYDNGVKSIDSFDKDNLIKYDIGASFCPYCGRQKRDDEKFQADHIFAKSVCHDDNIDNRIYVCPECNRSGKGGKGDRDFMEWMINEKDTFPSIFAYRQWMRMAYKKCKEMNVLDTPMEDVPSLNLPFDYHFLYQHSADLKCLAQNTPFNEFTVFPNYTMRKKEQK